MNVFADESVDRPIADRLRQDGHDVIYVAELAPSISDDEVLAQAIIAETFRDRALEMQGDFTAISAGTVRIRRYL